MSTNRSPDAGQYTLVELLGAIVIVAVAMCVALPSVELPMVSSPEPADDVVTVGFYRLEFDTGVDPREVSQAVRRHEQGDLYDVLAEADGTVLYVGLWRSTSAEADDLLVVFDDLPQRPRSVEPCSIPDRSELERLLSSTHG